MRPGTRAAVLMSETCFWTQAQQYKRTTQTAWEAAAALVWPPHCVGSPLLHSVAQRPSTYTAALVSETSDVKAAHRTQAQQDNPAHGTALCGIHTLCGFLRLDMDAVQSVEFLKG